jgi:hypothetical protein
MMDLLRNISVKNKFINLFILKRNHHLKATFKSKPITIIVEEDEDSFELTTEMKAVLDERLQEDEKTYLTAEDAINQLNKKYGL